MQKNGGNHTGEPGMGGAGRVAAATAGKKGRQTAERSTIECFLTNVSGYKQPTYPIYEKKIVFHETFLQFCRYVG